MKKIILLLLALLLQTAYRAQGGLLDSTTLANYAEYDDLKEALENPLDVVKLVLRKKKLRAFPHEIFKFKNLQYLDLSKNIIKQLPDSLYLLKDLQFLIVSNTELTALPNDIGKMKNLKYLNVNQNNIGRIPYSFGELTNLESADMWSNDLDYVPETLGNLKKLRMLDLRNILIPQTEQDNISAQLPNATIFFSPPCQCSW